MADPASPEIDSTATLLENDEISLAQVSCLLAKRKNIVIGAILLGLVVGGGISFFKMPVYESRAIIEVARIKNVPLVEPSLLATRLMQKYGLQKFRKIGRKPSYISVFVDNSFPDITIVARGPSAEKTSNFLRGIVAHLIQRQNSFYDQEISLRQSLLPILDNTILADQKQISQIGQRKIKNSDRTMVLLLSLEQLRLIEQIPSLIEKREQLVREISDLESSPARVVQSPTLLSGHKPSLYLILGGMMGLLIGTFIAFAVAFSPKKILKPEEYTTLGRQE